jgi:hypothetical protein
MPCYEIQPITDHDGNEFFSVVDLLDLSGNNEVAVFWTRHEAVKFVALSNEGQDIYPYAAVSLWEGDGPGPYLSHNVRLITWIFGIQENAGLTRAL